MLLPSNNGTHGCFQITLGGKNNKYLAPQVILASIGEWVDGHEASHRCLSRGCIALQHICCELRPWNIWRNACQKYGLYTAETCPHNPPCLHFAYCESFPHPRHIESVDLSAAIEKLVKRARYTDTDCVVVDPSPGSKRPMVWVTGEGGFAAARVVAQHTHGPPPYVWYQASHLCHDRCCVNPDHIIWEEPWLNALREMCEVLGKCVCGLDRKCVF